jgi:hypothetical protein
MSDAAREDRQMTKAEAVEWVRRARQGLRDAERMLRQGDAQELLNAVREVGGCAGELEGVLSSDYGTPRGIKGVN